MTVDVSKLHEAIDNLDAASAENGGIIDMLGILVDDFLDITKTNNSQAFNKQKKDCRTTLKVILRKLKNATFANKKIRERIEEESKNKEAQV